MGIDKGILKALADHKDRIQRPHFLLSVQSPKNSDKNVLNLTHEQVLHHLKGAGYDAHEVEQRDGENVKKSIVVYDINESHAEKLCKMVSDLGQNDGLFSKGEVFVHSERPSCSHIALPGNQNFVSYEKSEPIGTGVDNNYRKKAKTGGDVLWKVKIKGRIHLTEDIPLHMSLKVFDEKQEINLDEIKAKVKEFDIKTPDPKKLKFSTKIHHSDQSDADYFMLMVDGCDPSYKKFYDSIKGVEYKTYFMHVTIDKPLYDAINEEGLDPDEIEFCCLSVEKGAGNTIYEFENEELEKSLKHKVAGAMVAASTLLGSPASPKAPDIKAPPKVSATQAPMAQAPRAPASIVKEPAYSSKRMLSTISNVESSGGKQQNHKPLGGMHHGESAYGKYALMPNTIRDTIKMNPDLRAKYKKATMLQGKDLHRFMQDNPGLEDTIAQRHLKRLEHHFGPHPSQIGFAWLEGIRGTYKAKKAHQDIESHWHVKKIKNAYGQGK